LKQSNTVDLLKLIARGSADALLVIRVSEQNEDPGENLYTHPKKRS